MEDWSEGGIALGVVVVVVARPFQYNLPATSLTTQSNPSSNPSPVYAEHARILHLCETMLRRSRLYA
jgi:hypothetical protein